MLLAGLDFGYQFLRSIDRVIELYELGPDRQTDPITSMAYLTITPPRCFVVRMSAAFFKLQFYKGWQRIIVQLKFPLYSSLCFNNRHTRRLPLTIAWSSGEVKYVQFYTG